MTKLFYHVWMAFFAFFCIAANANENPTKSSTSNWHGLVPGNAVWIWDTTRILLNDPVERKQIFDFCKNPPGEVEPITTLFLYAGWPNFLRENKKDLRNLIRDIHAHGLKVHYTDGAPEWADKDRNIALRKIHSVHSFNQGGKDIEQFDAIQFDVEPYLLKNWRNPEVVNAYKEHLVECTCAAHQAKLPFGIALPNFYDTREDDLLDFIIKVVDYVGLMNYKDNAEMLITNARNEIKTANYHGKPIWLGVETQKPTPQYGVTPRETFFEEGYTKMENELKFLKAEFTSAKSMYGIAYHHLDSYRQLSMSPQIPNRPLQEVLPCPKIKNPIVIDGNLTEWHGRPWINVKDPKHIVHSADEISWKGVDDLSGVLYSGWDDDAFYVSGKITDDIIFQEATGPNIWRGDYVEIWFDTEPNYNPERTVRNNYTYQFGISPGDFRKQTPELYLWFPEGLNDRLNEIHWAIKEKASGYTFEARIPWNFIMVDKPRSGFRLRANVDLSDTDSREKEQKILMSTSPLRIHSDPTTFRTIQLVNAPPG